MKTVEERFWAKVDKTENCWLWTAARVTGYGLFWYESKNQYAHRVAHKLLVGEIPEGKELDHKCHNRACVNPEHMRIATRKQSSENMRGLKANNSSGERGVFWAKHVNKWCAQVEHNGVGIHVGYFVELADANAAVIAKRNELFTNNDIDRRAG